MQKILPAFYLIVTLLISRLLSLQCFKQVFLPPHTTVSLANLAVTTEMIFYTDDNRKEEQDEHKNWIENSLSDNNQLSEEISKLNELLQGGVLTQEEFEKAKKKILDN